MRTDTGPAIVTALCTLGAAVAQTTLLVPASYPTIQAAIVAATGGDTVLVAPGTYFETIDFLGKAITVRSASGPAVTTIDANQLGTVVSFVHGETPSSVLDGFTLTNGLGPTPVGLLRAAPGGVLCSLASPTIRGCVVTNNRGGDGASGTSSSDAGWGGTGGLFATGSEVQLVDCEFVGNFGGRGGPAAAAPVLGSAAGVGGDGGACLVLPFTPTSKQLVRCRFLANSGGVGGSGVDGGSGGQGGLFVSLTDGSVQLTDCEFRANQGGDGGAATGTGVHAGGDGGHGGFCLVSGAGGVFVGIVTMTNGVAVGNRGGNGGLGAHANGGAGGGYSSSPLVALASTFAGNVAGAPVGPGLAVGGLLTVGFTTTPTDLRNCILWGNVSGTLPFDLAAGGIGANVSTSDLGATSGTVLGAGNISVNPLFVGLAAGDVHLTAASPCRHAGAVVVGLPPFDLDGDPRIVGPAPDMGADEWDGLVGTREDFVFELAVNGVFAPAVVTSLAAANDVVALGVRSPGGSFANALTLLGLEAWLPPATPVGPAALPAIHLGPSAIVLLVLPSGVGSGASLSVAVPPGLAGLGLRLQAFALTPNARNTVFAASAARDLLL